MIEDEQRHDLVRAGGLALWLVVELPADARGRGVDASHVHDFAERAVVRGHAPLVERESVTLLAEEMKTRDRAAFVAALARPLVQAPEERARRADEPRLVVGEVGEPRRVGTPDNHLSFRVRQHNTTLKAIAFGMADRLDELMSDGGACCLAFTPKINEWQGRKRVELEVRDFQAGSCARLGEQPVLAMSAAAGTP